ncbi:hypothetical protein Y1Q_0021495 [Alligator mississippiensis]|uniref:Uncharacterized protein n=1 Tax=Alligator mississippiensis TaxID=8496 RepID=A0A151PA60_ALLMI|nr:hypothetical protein Y1Q_0021495 [Alligator mississippiensis]
MDGNPNSASFLFPQQLAEKGSSCHDKPAAEMWLELDISSLDLFQGPESTDPATLTACPSGHMWSEKLAPSCNKYAIPYSEEPSLGHEEQSLIGRTPGGKVVVIRLHEPGQERVGQIPDDEEWDSIGIPLGSPGEGGVLEDPGIANSASQDEG